MALTDADELPPCPSSPHPFPYIRCPKCHSDDVSFLDMREEPASERNGFTLTPQWRWSCEDCGTWGTGLRP